MPGSARAHSIHAARLGSETATLRASREHVAELDLVPVRPVVQTRPAEESARRPVDHGALPVATVVPLVGETACLRGRGLGGQRRAADVPGDVGVGVQVHQLRRVCAGEGREKEALGVEHQPAGRTATTFV